MNTKFTFGKMFFGIVILLFGGFLWATLKPSNDVGSALDRASEAAKGTAAKISDGATELKDKTAAIVDKAADRAGDMAGKVADQGGDVAGKMADQAGDMADKAADSASDAYRTTANMAQNAAESVMDKTGDMADQAAAKAGDAYQATERMAEKAMDTSDGMVGSATDTAGDTRNATGSDGEAFQASGDGMEKAARAIKPLAEVPMPEEMDGTEKTMASAGDMMAEEGNSMTGDQTGERMVEVPAKFEMKASGDATRPSMTDAGTWYYEAVRFDHNQWDLKPSTFASLNELAALMKSQPDLNIEIHGHTDSSGTRAYNMDLSRKRAESVKTYLESQGVASSRMMVKGFGPDRPISGKAYEGPFSDNRRIEIKPLN